MGYEVTAVVKMTVFGGDYDKTIFYLMAFN